MKRTISRILIATMLTTSLVPSSVIVQAKDYDESSYEIQNLDAIEFGSIDFTSDWKFYLSTTETNFVEEIVGEDGRVNNFSILKGLKDGEDGPQTDEIVQPGFDDSSWRTVQVPHDWGFEFGRTKGDANLPAGVGFYRKTFTVPKEYEGKKVSIEFDGVYMDSTVYVNGELVGEYPSGYMGFCYDISSYLNYGEENVITVRCYDKVSSSRWYAGRGIYRPVRILVDTDTRFVRNGVYLATPDIGNTYPVDQTADVLVNADVYSVKDVDNARIVATLYNPDGSVFATASSEGCALRANEKQTVSFVIPTSGAELWDTVTPDLYEAVVELYDGDEAVDSYKTSFGFKWFNASATEGFSLNGEYILLQGVNLHHENGMIGTVSEPDALMRKVQLMKDMGVNAIRTAHNPENQELMDACNKLGVMIVEESADHISGGKSAYDWGKWFNIEVPEDWAGQPDGGYPTVTLATDGEFKDAVYCWGDQHMQEMILRHRNNPCVIMWSTANELRNLSVEAPEWMTPEVLADLYGTDFNPEPVFGIDTDVIRLAQRALQVDPYHLIVQASDAYRAGVEETRTTYGEQWINVAKYLESIGGVLGTQYSVVQTVQDIRKWFPNLATCETEATHLPTGKGNYYGGGLITVSRDYTAGRVGGGGYNNGQTQLSPTREYCLKFSRDYGDINGGLFVWTGIDYMGEGMRPDIPNEPDWVTNSHHGFVDGAGFPKDSYYLFQSQWVSKDTKPMAYIVPDDWNVWSEGDDVYVEVYTNCPKAELFLNGESLGTREFVQKETTFGVSYYETDERTDDDNTNTSDVNTGGYLSPNGSYGKLHLTWTVPYAPGELKVVAYDDDGTALADYAVNTYSAPKSIILEANKETMADDGDGMIYVTASIVDENGVLCRDADTELYVDVEGAKIAAVSNGYQGEHEPWKFGGTQFTYHSQHLSHMGLMEIALQSEDPGKVTLTVYGDDLETGNITLFTVEDDEDDIIGYKDVYVRAAAGSALELPAQAEAVTKDGQVQLQDVTWKDLPDTSVAGVYEVLSDTPAKAVVTVYDITAIDPVELTVYGEAEAALPAYVHVEYSDGTTGFEPVSWEGTEGTVPGTQLKASAVITRGEDGVNVLDASRFQIRSTANYTSSGGRQAANVLDNDMASFWDNRVSNSTSLSYEILKSGDTSLKDSFLEFTWDEYQTLNHLDLYFVIGELLEDPVPQSRGWGAAAPTIRYGAVPGRIEVYSWDGMKWSPVNNTEVSFAQESLEPTSVDFDTITTNRIRVFMFNATPYTPDGTMQIAQVEAYAK